MTNKIKGQLDLIYKPDEVPLFETIYGKNLISLGGSDAIDNMFSDVSLRGLKALDIGFGLGGVAFYLANKYQLAITGIEVNDWMVDYANVHAPKEIAHLLTFATYNAAGEIPFQTTSFDLVYSKGVLNHVQAKHDLFLEIHRVLKADGLFVIADWIYSAVNASDNSTQLANETEATYRNVLQETGFKNISFRNDSNKFIYYVKKFLENMTTHREFLEKEFGVEMFSIMFNDHQKLIDNLSQQHKFAVRIKANK